MGNLKNLAHDIEPPPRTPRFWRIMANVGLTVIWPLRLFHWRFLRRKRVFARMRELALAGPAPSVPMIAGTITNEQIARETFNELYTSYSRVD